jgi:hypothetical protein
MEPIQLRSDLLEMLEQDAEPLDRSVNDMVNEAVEQYVRERQRTKLDREIRAYEAMHPELWQTYPGQWVAVHRQRLIDHDCDRRALYRRIRAEYGRTSVLIRKVTEHPTEEIWLRTPSTGRMNP